jgi:hypothetical protein
MNSPQDEPLPEDRSFYIFTTGKRALSHTRIEEIAKKELGRLLGQAPKVTKLFEVRTLFGTNQMPTCREVLRMVD